MNTDDSDGTKLFPAWRQVEVDIVASNPANGSTFTMKWLREGLGAADPSDMVGNEALRAQAEFNFAMGELRKSLLVNHRIALRLSPNVGYVVVDPQEQTRLTLADHQAEIGAAMRRAERGVAYVRLEQLSGAQRQENLDAQVKLATMRGMIDNTLKGKALRRARLNES